MDTIGYLRIFTRVSYYDSYQGKNRGKALTLHTEMLLYPDAKKMVDRFKADNPDMHIEFTFTVCR